MPVVLTIGGFRVIIFLPPREHSPAHVHVQKGGHEVVILLDPIEIRSVRRMPVADVTRAVRIVEAHRAFLLSEWRRIHGP